MGALQQHRILLEPLTAVSTTVGLEMLRTHRMRSVILILLAALPLSAAEPPITAATFAPDGKSILVGSQRGIIQLRWPQLDQRASLSSKLDHVHDLHFSPDGRLLSAVGGRPAESGGLEIYGWPATELLHRQRVGMDGVYQGSWGPNSQLLALAGPDLDVHLFDRKANPRALVTGHSRDVTTIAWLPGGHVVSAGRDQTLRVWRAAGRELVRTLNNHTKAVFDVAVRPGSRRSPFVLASASADKAVRLWWPVRGRHVRFAKLPSPALDICWAPDGESILAACADGHFRAIDPETVQITSDIAVVDSWLHTVAASPDGQHALVAGTEGLVRMVDLYTR